ncbi:MAG TPA: RagB/SusD family nutrient uptake outer membrane protein, partial [Gemmatimonadetes bacterium]|nr:RagB/SusD family nutrient uptake outer membrane protein [Gemmatimonadota bacterium]
GALATLKTRHPDMRRAVVKLNDGFSGEGNALFYFNGVDGSSGSGVEFNIDDENVTIGETYRGVMTEGVPDPRISVFNPGILNSNSGIPVWQSDKYPSGGSPVQVASWEEAQLIIAENHIDTGSLASAVAIFDALHAAVGLPAYSGAVTKSALMSQLIFERSAEMFLEGHHLQDIKRLNIPLFPAKGVSIPFGGSYGDQMCFVLPATEFQNNLCISEGICG